MAFEPQRSVPRSITGVPNTTVALACPATFARRRGRAHAPLTWPSAFVALGAPAVAPDAPPTCAGEEPSGVASAAALVSPRTSAITAEEAEVTVLDPPVSEAVTATCRRS